MTMLILFVLYMMKVTFLTAVAGLEIELMNLAFKKGKRIKAVVRLCCQTLH